MLSTTNNIRLNIERLSAPKEVIRALQLEVCSNKENQERKSKKSPSSNKKRNEGLNFKQIYGSLAKKIASKKKEHMEGLSTSIV